MNTDGAKHLEIVDVLGEDIRMGTNLTDGVRGTTDPNVEHHVN